MNKIGKYRLRLCDCLSNSKKTWKHLFFWQYPTYLHARVPKLKDKEGKVKMVKLPWVREGSGFTLSFEAMALELMKHIPLSKLGEHLQEDGERLMRIATYYVNKSKEKADYSKITSGGIDETSRKKGHNYLTTFVNFKTKKYLV
ncbi:MAG: helix-turn-helix domain-containing protein [Candidatus Gracilibacteria bacterium]|nr:helix-turn-helix domain-containing protein [Candidatus Gracilibacteria bacterium]